MFIHVQNQNYFEIEKEDDFRRKGPSRENRKESIVGVGLLLDANQRPAGMKLFPGNQSKKPVIRNVIDSLKKRNSVSGRTIRTAVKGLNCAENIFHTLKNGDGYLFSKSVKQLPGVEKHGSCSLTVTGMLKMPMAVFCTGLKNATISHLLFVILVQKLDIRAAFIIHKSASLQEKWKTEDK